VAVPSVVVDPLAVAVDPAVVSSGVAVVPFVVGFAWVTSVGVDPVGMRWAFDWGQSVGVRLAVGWVVPVTPSVFVAEYPWGAVQQVVVDLAVGV
jgi:hypothetical protein